MADFTKILATLRKEEKQLARQATQIRSAIDALTGDGIAPIPLRKRKAWKKAAQKKPGRTTMSAAAREAVSKRMKKYWAKRKKR